MWGVHCIMRRKKLKNPHYNDRKEIIVCDRYIAELLFSENEPQFFIDFRGRNAYIRTGQILSSKNFNKYAGSVGRVMAFQVIQPFYYSGMLLCYPIGGPLTCMDIINKQ